MSYQVLARKWRPQSFNELIGQDHISNTLRNALKENRLAHAFLFTGPRGTGKTSTARILAKSLRCVNAENFVPCLKCSQCLEISTGRNIDVLEIDGASNNGVDSIRELRDSVAYRPSSGTYKVYIIDEVHMLSSSAFNALLKTLEEPPAHVVFILATTEVHKIPATILSRCQRFDFRRIPTAKIVDHLNEICKAESISASSEGLWLIARQAEGSMRDSQSLLETVITFSDGNLSIENIVAALGLTDREILNLAVEGVVKRDISLVLEVVKRLAQSSVDPRVFAQDFLLTLRHLLFIKLTPAHLRAEMIDLSVSEIEKLEHVGAALTDGDVHLLFDMMLKGCQDLMRSWDSYLVLEMVLIRMSQAPRIQALDALFVATAAPPTTAAAMPPAPLANAAMPPVATAAATGVVTAATVAAAATANSISESFSQKASPLSWSAVVEKVKKANPVIGAKLENCVLVEVKGKHWILGVPPQVKFLFDQVNAADFRQKVKSYLDTYMGSGHSVEFLQSSTEVLQDSPKNLAQKEKETAEMALRQKVEAHPMVQSLRKTFGAEIKKISDLERS